ncbi:hypothetical protein Tco_1003515 [Tanacetum coccineum]|uniref:Uncharacterized protein n=1 Tax=Tanacetum coccineum TaxID=301880 RepID=A0ABQ5FB76_9ASTR
MSPTAVLFDVNIRRISIHHYGMIYVLTQAGGCGVERVVEKERSEGESEIKSEEREIREERRKRDLRRMREGFIPIIASQLKKLESDTTRFDHLHCQHKVDGVRGGDDDVATVEEGGWRGVGAGRLAGDRPEVGRIWGGAKLEARCGNVVPDYEKDMAAFESDIFDIERICDFSHIIADEPQLIFHNIPDLTNPTSHVHTEEDNTIQVDDAVFDAYEFTNPFAPKTKIDHPLAQVGDNPSNPIQTRRHLATNPELCMFALTVSKTKQKNIKEAIADDVRIKAMQEELHQFDRLVVWELVTYLDC